MLQQWQLLVSLGKDKLTEFTPLKTGFEHCPSCLITSKWLSYYSDGIMDSEHLFYYTDCQPTLEIPACFDI